MVVVTAPIQSSEVQNLAVLPPDFFQPTESEVLFWEYQEHQERKALLEAERYEAQKTGFFDWQLGWLPETYEAYTYVNY